MVDKWNITIPELTGEEERLAYVYPSLPLT